jgi:hypothetical protein
MTAARTLVLAIMFGSATSVAFAQARVPDSGMAAVSGNIGAIFPKEPFEADVALSGAFDYYLRPECLCDLA